MVAYFKALNWSLVPSTVPILLVSTESVCSSHPPPLSPSLNLMRIDWLLSRTTRILMAAVTVVGCKCSSMNIMIQSKPSVLTSSSQALFKDRQVQRKGISFRNSDFKLVNFEPRFWDTISSRVYTTYRTVSSPSFLFLRKIITIYSPGCL